MLARRAASKHEGLPILRSLLSACSVVAGARITEIDSFTFETEVV
jgi:hypothetical protein